jgi:hypothetical protein
VTLTQKQFHVERRSRKNHGKMRSSSEIESNARGFALQCDVCHVSQHSSRLRPTFESFSSPSVIHFGSNKETKEAHRASTTYGDGGRRGVPIFQSSHSRIEVICRMWKNSILRTHGGDVEILF